HSLELGGLLYREISRFVALEDAAGIVTSLIVRPHDAGAITGKPTSLRIFAPRVSGRQGIAGRKCDNLSAPVGEECTGTDKERINSLPDCRDECCFQVYPRPDPEDNQLSAKGAYLSFDVFFRRLSAYTCCVLEEPNCYRLGHQFQK